MLGFLSVKSSIVCQQTVWDVVCNKYLETLVSKFVNTEKNEKRKYSPRLGLVQTTISVSVQCRALSGMGKPGEALEGGGRDGFYLIESLGAKNNTRMIPVAAGIIRYSHSN